jgi:PIN domain nuclease of toxin-antitoxin system
MRYLLDTGIWLRLSREPDTLPEACRTLLSAEPQVGLSAVSLREVAWKVAHGKLDLGQPTLAWFKAALTSQLVLLPLTPEIAADSAVGGADFQSAARNGRAGGAEAAAKLQQRR